MCGIAGAITARGLACDEQRMTAMLDAIRHRGPDDSGIWHEGAAWLGHRRLAIIDVTPSGHQPMMSRCGRFVISYNGEIYNFNILREQLQRAGLKEFRGHSDTEVLLEHVAAFGLAKTLEQANGMFAFAVWDREEQALYLARDRFGEKPLYYTTQGGGIAFASELVALERLPGLQRTISANSLFWYFRAGYVPAPFSIYQGIQKLPPACMAKWTAKSGLSVDPYWSITDVAEASARNRFVSEQDAIDTLENALLESCRQRMISDVPLGAFLSGGIDSSTVVAMMQKVSATPVRTFTIGFDQDKFNEAEHARDVASHLGTMHTELYLTGQDALQLVPELGALSDEPFADSSLIPTYLVSRLARQHVTVALSGDGGDELFAGYVRHRRAPQDWAVLQRVPMRRLLGRSLTFMGPGMLDLLGRPFAAFLSRLGSSDDPVGVKAYRFASRLGVRDFQEYFEILNRYWLRAEDAANPGHGGELPWSPPAPATVDRLEWMCWHDTVNYLPGDILTKVDRAAMQTSLEGRMPFLDPAVAEVAWRMPESMKLRGGTGKWALRQVLGRHVPERLFDRPKMGFGVPLAAWLKGPLRDLTDDMLSEPRLKRQGLVNAAAVARTWQRTRDGIHEEPGEVWSALMLQLWLSKRGM